MIGSVLKANPWTYRIKDINGETIIGLIIGYYLEPDIYIRDKVKVVLDLSNYVFKKEI